jgi:molybdate transport system substrate-binding protein
VVIPADLNVPASYPIATVAEAPNPDAGEAFVEYVLSGEGQDVLNEFGFSSP